MMEGLKKDLLKELLFNDPVASTRTAFQQKRLEELYNTTAQTVDTAYRDIADTVENELVSAVEYEARFTAKSVNTSVGFKILENNITSEQAQVLVTRSMIEGAPNTEWWDRQATDTQNRFIDTMRQGVLRGETLQELSQRVKGGTRKGVEIGGIAGLQTPNFMKAPTRNAEALVRTAYMTMMNETRAELFKGNEDVLQGTQFLATFDLRVCPECLAYSGATFDLEGNPIKGTTVPYRKPILHWGCRCVEVPLTKDFEELFGKGKGKIPEGTRASMDGEIPADTPAKEWLSELDKEDPSKVDDMLGAGKAQLWRDGQITLQDLVNDQGEKTLADLNDELGND